MWQMQEHAFFIRQVIHTDTQMKYAGKIGAKFTAILGTDELEKGVVNVKNMESGESTPVNIDEITKFFIEA